MELFSIFFFIAFFLILGTIIFMWIKGISQWNKNNNSPRLTVEATVVTKRTEVSTHHHNAGDSMHISSSTTYYVIFQVESGDRMELRVNHRDYAMLAEGDNGRLSFQGTRFLAFDRN